MQEYRQEKPEVDPELADSDHDLKPYWTFHPIIDKTKVLDVSRGSNENTLIIYHFHNGDNQRFDIIQK